VEGSDHMTSDLPNTNKSKLLPRIFIVGGGFGGIEVARQLANLPVEVTIVDRRNYHLFQPLLYQVATATLSPADIAAPIRSVVRDIENCRVVLAKVRGVDLKAKRLLFKIVAVPYDWLILAAGATHSYFGHDEWAEFAPGLKTIEDATEIRRKILLAFESAEYEGSEERRIAGLTFAIVGGGATGVELAGAIKEIAAQTIPRDFRKIDTKSTKVILLQGGDRLLPQFSPKLSEQAKNDLEAMGVEVRLNTRVTEVTAEGVRVGDEFVPARNVFWAAGVQANPISKSLGVQLDKSGRVLVDPDLTVPGFKDVFVIGDMATIKSADNGKEVPGVAQAALQMGSYVGKVIAEEIRNNAKKDASRKPFSYFDKGSMATIGKARAVAQIGSFGFSGFFAWMLWCVIHIFFLVGFRNRIGVVSSWFWNWLISARDVRLITGDARMDIKEVRPGEHVLQVETEEANHSITNDQLINEKK
jgi:NADH:ubiquinone reductase (H+-translocating)